MRNPYEISPSIREFMKNQREFYNKYECMMGSKTPEIISVPHYECWNRPKKASVSREVMPLMTDLQDGGAYLMKSEPP